MKKGSSGRPTVKPTVVGPAVARPLVAGIINTWILVLEYGSGSIQYEKKDLEIILRETSIKKISYGTVPYGRKK